MVCINRVTDELSHALKSLIYASSQALTIYVKLSYLQWRHIYGDASQYIFQYVAPYLVIFANTWSICAHACRLMISDCQKMVKLWLSLKINLSMSVVLCNMSLALWCVDIEHRDSRRL
jgi:hypothetical protein